MMRRTRQPQSSYQALILIANRFDEVYVVQSFCQLREAGLSVALVSTRTGVVHGNHGLGVVPNLTISDVEASMNVSLIVPGDERCITSLLADPRVCALLEKTNRSWHTIVTVPEASRLFLEVGLRTITPSDCLLATDANMLHTSLENMIRSLS